MPGQAGKISLKAEADHARINQHMKIEDIKENYPDALLADGFDECIVGVTIEGQVVYDVNKMIEQMMSQDGMDQDIAQEYFYFNYI